MANIQARRNKAGEVISYSIRVFKGRDPLTGKQLKPYTMTWAVPENWTEKRAEKEARRQAALFEQQCRDGLALDNRQTFAEYAAYVLDIKERTGQNKLSTIYTYRKMLEVVNAAIGYMKLSEIRPQHLNLLYQQLADNAPKRKKEMAVCKVDLRAVLEQHGFCPNSFWVYTQALAAGGKRTVSRRSLNIIFEGRAVREYTAHNIAFALKERTEDLFDLCNADDPYAANYIIRYHRLISTVLEQAVKEMLLTSNPCRRATIPKKEKHEPNYFQPDTVEQILQALEGEPIKWKAMVHMFLVTGCRRGEILGMKWGKVDWANSQIFIDTSVLYTPEQGLYEDTPKTGGSVRCIKLPQETMSLLKDYRRWYEAEPLKWGDKWVEKDYLFPRDNGEAMNPGYVNDWLARFSKKHGLPHINPHAFRHTQASILCFNGIDIASISHRLGHTNISTTTDIYSHVIKQAEEKVSECIADVIIKPKDKVVPFPKEKIG